MNQLRFRTRLVLILSLFAIIPALLLTLLWSGTVSTALPLLSGRAGWDSVAATGKRAAIGAMADLSGIIAGVAGTTVSADHRGIAYGV